MAEKLGICLPGPQPYGERDREYFHGRRTETIQLGENLKNDRVTLLAGVSGTGKTSLINAGVIPLLRLERYAKKQASVWPVMLLRNWGGRDSNLFLDLIKGQIDDALGLFDNWEYEGAASDKKLLIAARDEAAKHPEGATPGGFLDQMARYVTAWSREDPNREQQGLLLIFDQFEEIFRSDKKDEAQAMVRELSNSPAALRLLISMRQEYSAELQRLDHLHQKLRLELVILDPMPEPIAREVIRATAKDSHIELADAMEDRLIEIGESTRPRGSASGSPNLLRLQLILFWVFAEAARTSGRKVTKGVLDRVVGSDSRAFLTRAASSWIDDAIADDLPDVLGKTREVGDSELERQLADFLACDQLNDHLRHVATRIAPLLSASDYKVPREEVDLLRRAVSPEIPLLEPIQWDRLAIRRAENERPRLIVMPVGTEGDPDTIQNAERLDFVPSEEGAGPAGAARRQWQLTVADLYQQRPPDASQHQKEVETCCREVAQKQLDLFFLTLERLQRGNILKKLGTGSSAVWELVHDQMGPPFLEWANARRGHWNDCVNSLIASLGVTPIAVTVEDIERQRARSKDPILAVDNLVWKGCVVTSPGRERPAIERVVFTECEIRGSIFRNCDFRETTFGAGCDLRGIIFQSCSFSGKDVEHFKGADLSGGIFSNCSFERTTFGKGCNLAGLLFDQCELGGGYFHDCRLDGVIFRKCGLGRPQTRDVTEGSIEFEKCSPSGLLITDSTVQQLAFKNCSLNQPTFVNIELIGDVVFDADCYVLLGQFGSVKVARRSEKSGRFVFDRAARARSCSGEKPTFNLIDWPKAREFCEDDTSTGRS